MDWLIPQFGFSYIGLIFLLLLFVPNLFWTKNQPKGYDSTGESRGLQLLERVGEILVTVMVLSFADLNLRPWSGWSWFLVAAAVCMIFTRDSGSATSGVVIPWRTFTAAFAVFPWQERLCLYWQRPAWDCMPKACGSCWPLLRWA